MNILGDCMIKASDITSAYVQQHPYVGDDGVYIPHNEYVPAGCTGTYKCVMTKEMFIEAYNKWIKEGN
jgi:hypothetical protein